MDKSEELTEKLKELKLTLIGLILKNRSDDDWEEFKGRNAEEWIEKESMQILLTEELVNLMVDKSEIEVRRIFAGFLSSSSVTSRAVQRSLVKLCTTVSDQMGEVRCWWNGHRVVCWVLGWMVEKCRKDGWSDKTIDCVVDYMVKLLESEDQDIEMQTILTRLSKKLWFETQLGNKKKFRPRADIIRHSALTDTWETYFPVVTTSVTTRSTPILIRKPVKRPRGGITNEIVSNSRPEKSLRSNSFKTSNIETSLSSNIPLTTISPSFAFASIIFNQSNNYYNQATQSIPTEISNESIRLTHKWAIKNFKSFFKKGSKPLSVMYSDPFPVSNLLSNKVQFSLRLVPSFKEDTKDAYVSLFLYLEHCVQDAISVKYKITIINADSSASLIEDNGNKIQIFRPEQFWGNEKFVALNKLLNESNGFLADGKLTISCQVETAGQETNDMDNLQFKIISSPESLFDCNVKVARFHYIWKVKKFGALFYRTKECNNLFEAKTSPKFWSKNHQNKNQTEYYLRLWPKGVDELNKDFVALHLFLESQTKQELTVHYRLSILNWKNEIHHSGEGRFEKIQPLLSDSNKPKNESAIITLGKGSSRYISRKDVLNLDNGLLPEDTLTLCCEIEEITKL